MGHSLAREILVITALLFTFRFIVSPLIEPSFSFRAKMLADFDALSMMLMVGLGQRWNRCEEHKCCEE